MARVALLVAFVVTLAACGGNITDNTSYNVDTYCDHGNRVYHSSNGSIAVVPGDQSCAAR